MTSQRFALLIISPFQNNGANQFLGSVIGRQPAFQFSGRGPWSLFCTQSGDRHTIEYMRPNDGEISDGLDVESAGDVITRVIQSIPRFTFSVDPQPQQSNILTMMSWDRPSNTSGRRTHYRCKCTLSSMAASYSPDIKSLLYDANIFEGQMSDVIYDLLKPKKRRIRSLVEDYQAAIDVTIPTVGMRLPCQLRDETEESFAACVLTERIGTASFICDVFFDKAVALDAGSRLVRLIRYEEPKSKRTLMFDSEVAVVDKVLS